MTTIQIVACISTALALGIILGKFVLSKRNGQFSSNLFEMFKSDTSDDNLDRSITLAGIFFLNFLVIVALFITDWFFEKEILTDTVIGILIGNVLGWIQSSVTFFFRTQGSGKSNGGT